MVVRRLPRFAPGDLVVVADSPVNPITGRRRDQMGVMGLVVRPVVESDNIKHYIEGTWILVDGIMDHWSNDNLRLLIR